MVLIGHMKNNRNIFLGVIAACMLVVLGCDSESKKQAEKPIETKPLPAIVTAEFNADSAYKYVADQVAFGPRVPNTKPHVECGEFLARFFMNNGGFLYRQEFTAKAFD